MPITEAELAALREERDRLNTRCHELERARELFQEQRDAAIREQRAAEQALADVSGKTIFARQVDALEARPFSLVIVRVAAFDDPAETKAFQQMMAWLCKRHRELTFIVTHADQDLRIEAMPEAQMRAKGWVRAERVEPGPRVLEAACGAYRAALQSFLQTATDSATVDDFCELERKVEALLAQPLPAIAAAAPPKPEGGGA